MWVLLYWCSVYSLRIQKGIWVDVYNWLDTHSYMPWIPALLGRVPWECSLSHPNLGSSLDLARFLSDSWLADPQVNQMVAYLRSQLSASEHHQVILEDIYWSNTLIWGYRKREIIAQAYSGYSILETVANHLLDGKTKLAFPVFVAASASSVKLPSGSLYGNHWVAIVIDFEESCILYGDSLGKSCPKELTDALDWFCGQSFPGKVFIPENLPCGTQTDSDSCALHALEAIAHFILPEKYLIKKNGIDPVVLRKRWYENIIGYLQATVSYMYHLL
ncbi:hypothetical protein K435DRAFT_661904 [Dendrothele bispora CBS 962.96]|uniref:Ubiquitin-like protease family profile domain-containing protein n=1 Tax=Dendrothele bispora (strain CBS 962.96) TaxID=1314807 RepID=A0A4S8M6P6_DENBC|nr:hypothetical protein K435DRAFT_661904 [Dendrothele bispora CBS 962.96]